MTDTPETPKPAKTSDGESTFSNPWVKAGVGAAAIGSAAIVAALLYTKNGKDKDKDKGKKA